MGSAGGFKKDVGEFVDMTTDSIKEIKIDDLGRLCITPEKERFDLIYRAAAEVHWDNNNHFLFSPKPREWSYLDWYGQILGVVKDEYGCKLSLTDSTTWVNIPPSLMQQIKSFTL